MTQKEKNPPKHIGIIIDGNRRWAIERNLPVLDGHLKGFAKIKQAPKWFFSQGVEVLSILVFANKNWNHEQEEINYTMKMLKKWINEEIKESEQKNYKIAIKGKIDYLPGDLPEDCRRLIDKTKNKTHGTLNIFVNYDGREEIMDAIKKMLKNKISLEQVHEGMLKKNLYAGELPDPEILVHIGGSKNLSGFLLWQAQNSQVVFLDKYWPDFEESDLDMILKNN